MPQSTSKRPVPMTLMHEFLLSAYCSYLFAWAEESRPFAWGSRGAILYFWHPHAVSLGRNDFLFFYLELFLIPAAAIFIFLGLISLSSFGKRVLRVLEGTVALAGFPLVCEIRLHSISPLFGTELALATICLFLWAYRKWLVSTTLNIVLLCIHFAMWSAAGVEFVNWNRPSFWDYAWLMLPVIGFSYSLVWARYYRQTELGGRSQESLGRAAQP